MLGSILSALGLSVGGFKTYLWVGLGVTLIGLSGGLYAAIGAYQGAKEAQAVLQDRLDAKEAELVSVLEDIRDQARGLEEVQDRLDKSYLETQKLKKALQGARSKEHVAAAKPGLVGKRINNATRGLFESISQATGGRGRGDTSTEAGAPGSP